MSVGGEGVSVGGGGAMSNDFVQLALKLNTNKEFAAKLKELLDTKAKVAAEFDKLAKGQSAEAILAAADAKAVEINTKWSTLEDEITAARNAAARKAQDQLDAAVKRAAAIVDEARLKSEAMIAQATITASQAERLKANAETLTAQLARQDSDFTTKAKAFDQRQDAVMAMAEETRVEKARLTHLAQSLIALAKQI